LSPCAVLAQMSPRGQVRVLREYTSLNAGVTQLIENNVRPSMTGEFLGMTLGIGACDPAGGQRAQHDKNLSCIQTLNQLGFPTVVAPTNDFVVRRQSVENFLTRMVDGQPAILIDKSCRTLIEGFEGAYRFEKLQVSGSEERYSEQAHKNHPTSDIHDAFQYLCMHLDPRSVLRHPVKPVKPPEDVLAGMI